MRFPSRTDLRAPDARWPFCARAVCGDQVSFPETKPLSPPFSFFPSSLPHLGSLTQQHSTTPSMSTASPPQAPGVFGQPQQERQSSTPPSPSSKRGLIGGVKSVASSVSLFALISTEAASLVLIGPVPFDARQALHIASLALAETEPVEAIDSAVHASKGQLELLFEQISHNTLARGEFRSGACPPVADPCRGLRADPGAYSSRSLRRCHLDHQGRIRGQDVAARRPQHAPRKGASARSDLPVKKAAP